MPIEVDAELRVLEREAFHDFAYRIMGQIFATHNEFSRLIEETPFKNAIRRRCEQVGILPARREVEISVSHKGFRKSYFMDLLFGDALMVEAKTVDVLTPAHEAQAIHYLLLTGMNHGLLVNLRTPKVVKRFVSTNLDSASRYRFAISDASWRAPNEISTRVRELFEDLLNDWGAFLSVSLYREAIAHLIRGPGWSLSRIPIFDGQFQIGMHEVLLLDDRTAVVVTALTDGEPEMESQLKKLLMQTNLSCLQWINLHYHQIEFTTISC